MNSINPFLKGGYAKNDDFIGRDAELHKLRTLINSGAGGISIVGQQRIGKTSVAKKIYTELRNEGKPVIWLDLGEKESPAALFNELTDEVLNLFSSQKNKVREYLDVDAPVTTDDSAAYRRFRSFLGLIEPRPVYRIVIFLDEFDAIRNFDTLGKVPQRLRTLLDNCDEYNVTFVLISRRTIYALEQCLSHCSTLDGQCEKIFIKPLQIHEAQLMIEKLDRPLTDVQQNELVDFAGKHPYLLKKALADLWESGTIGEQAKAELLGYFEKLSDLLKEDRLWSTLVQEIVWKFHDTTDAEAFARLESYGLLVHNENNGRSWSASLDMYVEQNIRDASLSEPWAQTEIKFRQLIASVLNRKFGSDWLIEIRKIAKINSIFTECDTKRERTLKTLKIASDSILDYTYTFALWEIASCFWTDFEEHFGKGKHNYWRDKICIIGNYRNVIQHSNVSNLRDDQIREFYDIIGELDRVFRKAER